MSKFLHDVVNEIWYNDLKNANTFYTKVSAIGIMALLDANSRGLHALNMITLRTDMMQYYVQVDGIPQFIVMMEDAQKKAQQAGMPIADIKLVMMALVAVLAAQHFPQEVDDWEGLPATSCKWQALENGIPPCPTEVPAPTPGFGGRPTPWQCPCSDPSCHTNH